MPVVWVPALLRPLTGGRASHVVAGATVREVIDNLDQQYPGLKARLCVDDRLQPTLAVVVDGQTSPLKLRHPLTEASEVHFVVAISGGTHAAPPPAPAPRRPSTARRHQPPHLAQPQRRARSLQ